MTDCYGEALKDFYAGNRKAKIKVESDVAETEYWPLKEFFHSEKDMSAIERKALSLCNGVTLDVGAGAGSHTLWLEEHGLHVDAIDISEGAVEVMRKRGARNAFVEDFYKLEGRRYDTILMLMNGLGLAQSIENMPRFLQKVKELLAPGGQLVADSSDIIGLFAEDDGSVLIDLNGAYYGELEYTMTYKGVKGEPFKWIFIDFDTLSVLCEQHGLKAEKIMEDENNQYLAVIRWAAVCS